MELIEYNHVAGHHCRIRNCKEVPYHNDLKDHHSHRICLECNTRIQKEEEKSIKYYKKEEELKQKRKLKEYQAQDLARILTEKYLEKTVGEIAQETAQPVGRADPGAEIPANARPSGGARAAVSLDDVIEGGAAQATVED